MLSHRISFVYGTIVIIFIAISKLMIAVIPEGHLGARSYSSLAWPILAERGSVTPN